jgi:hypothetical protein
MLKGVDKDSDDWRIVCGIGTSYICHRREARCSIPQLIATWVFSLANEQTLFPGKLWAIPDDSSDERSAGFDQWLVSLERSRLVAHCRIIEVLTPGAS